MSAALWLAAGLVGATPARAFDAGRAAFSVSVNGGLVIPYRVFAIYVVPGETLRIGVVEPSPSGAADASRRGAARARPAYQFETRGGTVDSNQAEAWVWTAPAAPGRAELTIRGGENEVRLNVLVMHPIRTVRNGSLRGYRIGDYPAPLNGNPVYRRPGGFIELGEHDGDVELSPHFRLSQFPSKQSQAFPKYLVLREELLLKLELLLEHVNASGVSAGTFSVMSGFRTPFYNRAIGNGRHSRHVFGGAADIYVDVSPADGRMDDLDGDGVVNHRDAQWLYRRAEELFGRTAHKHLRGGLGVYRSTSAHGPFLHVDARGMRARWGLVP